MRSVRVFALACCGLALAASMTPAAARHRHRHHFAQPRFVWADPRGPANPYGAAFVGGYVETGILPAFTADPYRAPAIGFRQDGSYGPGFAYPDP